MAPRANWKGFLKIGDLACPVALYSAASTSERIVFHMLNRATGNRVHRQFIDERSGRVVESEDQVKGYEAGKGEYVILEPEEIAAAFPKATRLWRLGILSPAMTSTTSISIDPITWVRLSPSPHSPLLSFERECERRTSRRWRRPSCSAACAGWSCKRMKRE